MVVALARTAHASALQGLFFIEGSEHPEYDGHAGVELHAHERLRDALTDVLEVHGRAFDEHPDRNHGVEGLFLGAGCAAADDRRPRSWGANVEAPQQVRGGCAGLDMGTGDHPTVKTLRVRLTWSIG